MFTWCQGVVGDISLSKTALVELRKWTSVSPWVKAAEPAPAPPAGVPPAAAAAKAAAAKAAAAKAAAAAAGANTRSRQSST